MQVIILKYVQLFCLTIFLSNNANCAEMVIGNEVQKSYKVSACMANCLKEENKVSGKVKKIITTIYRFAIKVGLIIYLFKFLIKRT